MPNISGNAVEVDEPNMAKDTNLSALGILVLVFFFWGFIAAGNGIFIPFCKHFFELDQFQSQLIDFAFYTAYYFGALVLFIVTTITKKDLIGIWGYKNSIIFGLLFSAIGALVMILAVQNKEFIGMLTGLFMVALGFSLQQTAANPFAILLGNPKTGADRVNLGGAVNSLGTTIGPLVIAFALFGSTESLSDDQIAHLDLNKVTWMYSIVALLFVVAALVFVSSKKVPSGKYTEAIVPASRALMLMLFMSGFLMICFAFVFDTYKSTTSLESDQLEFQRISWLIAALLGIIGILLFTLKASKSNALSWGAMQFPQLILGMLGVFVYVGVEVSIGSNLGELLKNEEFGGFQASEIAPFISMYWGSLMIGRWAAAVHVFKLKPLLKKVALITVPLLAFMVIIAANVVAKKNVDHLWAYIVLVFIQILGFLFTGNNPNRALLVFSIFGMTSLLVGLNSSGITTVYAFLAGGLACSIMWPAIFSMSLMGLGKYTAQGSAFLIMMILGGGVIPPIQGKLADIVGIHQSYWLALLAFGYLAFFAIRVPAILRKQSIIE